MVSYVQDTIQNYFAYEESGNLNLHVKKINQQTPMLKCHRCWNLSEKDIKATILKMSLLTMNTLEINEKLQ